MRRVSGFHFGLQALQRCALITLLSSYIPHLPSTPLLSHCRFTESGEEVRLWPLFPTLRRGEQSLTSPHCVALVPCESWCLAVVGKQLTVTQECLLTGRSSKFKADPLPWLGKMHSIQGKGSGLLLSAPWCCILLLKIQFTSLRGCRHSRERCKCWTQITMKSISAARSENCKIAGEAKYYAGSCLHGVVYKRPILCWFTFVYINNKINSIKSATELKPYIFADWWQCL